MKVPIIEVPLSEEQLARIAEIDAFLIEHSVKVNRKKKKLLAGLPKGPYETYKLGVVIANCCKVFFQCCHSFLVLHFVESTSPDFPWVDV